MKEENEGERSKKFKNSCEDLFDDCLKGHLLYNSSRISFHDCVFRRQAMTVQVFNKASTVQSKQISGPRNKVCT